MHLLRFWLYDIENDNLYYREKEYVDQISDLHERLKLIENDAEQAQDLRSQAENKLQSATQQ